MHSPTREGSKLRIIEEEADFSAYILLVLLFLHVYILNAQGLSGVLYLLMNLFLMRKIVSDFRAEFCSDHLQCSLFLLWVLAVEVCCRSLQNIGSCSLKRV